MLQALILVLDEFLGMMPSDLFVSLAVDDQVDQTRHIKVVIIIVYGPVQLECLYTVLPPYDVAVALCSWCVIVVTQRKPWYGT